MAAAGWMAPDRDVSPARDAMLTAPSGPTRLRYSNFDSNLFALGHTTSPEQAKRALEAHLADTQQRMEEAGRLGTTLLQQQKELSDRLKEVEMLQAEEAEMTPELNRKLAELEQEYTQVIRDSARAFIPRSRVPSNEDPSMAVGSPFASQGTGGRRSVSPSKFESRASGSPTKLSVPNRKQRNQPTSRIHDIEFATEISNSLIQQVRHLQALLSEKEEELKNTKAENSRLEVEFETYQQRIKALDESEHRYKDENWNLETQVHELLAAQKESADREKKLTQTLNALQADKNSTQRELDEVKVSLSKLDEKHAAAVKQHDIELGTAKRKEIMADSERAALQRKIDDLTSQNQELAKAFSLQRGRALEREAALDPTNDELQAGDDAGTPEHSPPPSPIKGTPRHPGLESETMRTSLMHSQRTIQTLRNNIHREKTEKLELRRMLQDARDELERVRGEPNATTHRRSKKTDSKDFKKPLRLGQLGGARSSRSEISWEDPDWEDQDAEVSSQRPATASSGQRGSGLVIPSLERGHDRHLQAVDDSTDANFETAAEASDAGAFETAAETDAAFETAHEGTETEDFQTGAEEFSEDDDEATETEASPSKGVARLRRPPVLPYGQSRTSFESTASTSADDNDDENYSFASDIKTPTALQPQKLRSRISRGIFNLGGRRSRVASEEPNLNSSPASTSFTRSVSGTPQAPGQSLFAELGEFQGSDDDESFNDGGVTPSRRSLRSVTPGSHNKGWVGASPPPALPLPAKSVMVEQGTMTDPVIIGPVVEDSQTAPVTTIASGPQMAAMVDSGNMTDDHVEPQLYDRADLPLPRSDAFNNRPTSAGSVIRHEKLDAATQWLGDELQDAERSRPVSSLSYSDFGMQYDTDIGAKLAQFPSPPTSPPVLRQARVPEASTPARLSVSPIHAEDVEPVAEPIARPVTPVALELSSTLSEHVVPIEADVPEPSRLDSSSVLVSLDDEPIAPEGPPPAPVTFADMQAVEVQPRELEIERLLVPVPTPVAIPAPEPAPVSLSLAAVHEEEIHPRQEPAPALPPLSTVLSQAEEVVPEEVPAPAPIQLSIASLQAEELHPRQEPKAAQTVLSTTLPHVLEIEPYHEPQVIAPTLSHATMVAQAVAPVSPPKRKEDAPLLSLSTVHSLDTEPCEANLEAPVPLGFSSMQYVDSQPVAESPRNLKREMFIIPEGESVPGPGQHDDLPKTPTNALFGSYQTRNKNRAAKGSPEPLVIAEDETRQSLNASPVADTPDSQRPLKERSSNPLARPPPRNGSIAMSDSEAQTSLTWNAIDEMLKAAEHQPVLPLPTSSTTASSFVAGSGEVVDPFVATPEAPVSVVKRASVDSQVGSVPDSPATAKRIVTPLPPLVRRSNSTSSNFGQSPPPPLPPNHKEVIQAARLGSSHSGQGTIGLVSSAGSHGLIRHGSVNGGQELPPLSPTGRGTMGPPPLPVKLSMESARQGSSAGGQGTMTMSSMGPPLLPTHSRNRGYRPGTPKQSSISITSGRITPTPRAGRTDMYPPSSRGNTQVSRKSSMSSFVSELDSRFDIHNEMGMGVNGMFGARNPTDPRMIRAITQVMIGEYLWKYTRKAGREEMSENRHRRYFWLHPYNRTLYWSETDPGDTRRAEVKSKSLAIQAVRMVADTNPMPPGLHNKSLLVISGKRTIKFTAPTSQRHEIWFNALSFILKKPGEDEEVLGELADGITSEDVNEFNPGYSARAANGTRRAPSPSVASYVSRPSQSPALDMSMDIPTLTPQRGQRTPQGRLSTISKFGSFVGSLRSRSVNGRRPSLYDATSDTQLEANDSAEDLRAIIEQQDRESDRLENVRACCDGKHDVGALHHVSPKKGRHTHSHPPTPTRGRNSATPSALGSIRSRG